MKRRGLTVVVHKPYHSTGSRDLLFHTDECIGDGHGGYPFEAITITDVPSPRIWSLATCDSCGVQTKRSTSGHKVRVET